MGFGLYASPDYVAAHGAPASAGELRDHRVIDWLDGFPENAVVLWLRRQIGDNIPVFSTNPASARLAAARMGVGIALVPCMVAENLSGVVRLLPEDRKSVVEGNSLSVRVDLGGPRTIQNKKP